MSQGTYLSGLLAAKLAIAEIEGDISPYCTARLAFRKITARLNELIKAESDKPDCGKLPIVAGREEACTEPFHWDDGVPYCDTCGLYRSNKHTSR